MFDLLHTAVINATHPVSATLARFQHFDLLDAAVIISALPGLATLTRIPHPPAIDRYAKAYAVSWFISAGLLLFYPELPINPVPLSQKVIYPFIFAGCSSITCFFWCSLSPQFQPPEVAQDDSA